MKKKKLIFMTKTLRIGGAQKVLVNLVNNIDLSKYEVTILLQDKEGELLDTVNKNIKIEGYNRSSISFTPLRKVINLLKMMIVFLKHFRKYDFAACFGTGYPPSSVMALGASKNNAIWMHTNIIKYIENTSWCMGKNRSIETRCRKYLKKMHFRKFKYNIFVSLNGMKAYLTLYPLDEKKVFLCHNHIDGEYILRKSKEKVNDMFKKDVKTLINVSRHTERDKRLTRLINASERLKKDGYRFKIILVGDGENHDEYVRIVKEKQLDDILIFYGIKKNPLPYVKNADASILCSDFEGFPTTYTEALILNVPIITTNVSDAESFIKDKYGIVVSNDDTSIYDGMKEFLDNGYRIKKKFSYQKYNEESLKILYNLIERKEK